MFVRWKSVCSRHLHCITLRGTLVVPVPNDCQVGQDAQEISASGKHLSPSERVQ